MEGSIKVEVERFEHWKMHAIYFPTDFLDSQDLKIRDRVVVHFENGRKLQCALVSLEKGRIGIMLGKHFMEKADLQLGQSIEVNVSKDSSEYGMEMPEELAEVLSIDEEGILGFDALTPGRKRSVMYYVAKAKQEDTRIARALRVVENIKMGFTDPRDLVKKH